MSAAFGQKPLPISRAELILYTYKLTSLFAFRYTKNRIGSDPKDLEMTENKSSKYC